MDAARSTAETHQSRARAGIQNMVTGAKNPTSTNRPHHSALASRKNPTQAHPYRRDPRKRLYRARFYHAELGRFISRDPVGYFDGMSLYRAYFVPNGTDPSGKFLGWGYGNYCGFSRAATCPPGSGPRPIDHVDAACERHDCCQATIWTCNPYHLVKCSRALCLEVWDGWNFGCAQSWPNNMTKRDDCRRAAWDIMFVFCITHPPIWERPENPKPAAPEKPLDPSGPFHPGNTTF